MSNQLNTIEVQSTDLVFQQDKALIDIQIATAKAYPRNVKLSLENAITIVTLDKETASSCHYALPRGGKSISGPSVHLAKILAQNWGNLRVEAKVVDIGKTQITSQAIAFDLESNIAIKVEVKRSIMTKTGRMNDDMITVTGNAANAIALRNAVFSVIPKNIIDKAYNSAIQTIAGDLSSENKFIAAKKKLFEDFYAAYKVEENEILKVLGKTAINQATKEDYMTIYGLFNSIKDGDTTVEETFRKNTKPLIPIPEQKDEILDFINNEAKTLEALTQVKDKLTTDEQIIAYKNKENSFVVDQNPVIAPKPESKQELNLTQLAQAKYPENEFKDYIQVISNQFGVESLEELSPEEQKNQIELLNLKSN